MAIQSECDANQKSMKKPRCPREAKQRGRNREEAESNVIRVIYVEPAVNIKFAKFTKIPDVGRRRFPPFLTPKMDLLSGAEPQLI